MAITLNDRIAILGNAQNAAYAYWENASGRSVSIAVGKRASDGRMIITALASKANGELVRVGIVDDGTPIGVDHPSMARGLAKDMLRTLSAMPGDVRDALTAAHAAVHYA